MKVLAIDQGTTATKSLTLDELDALNPVPPSNTSKSIQMPTGLSTTRNGVGELPPLPAPPGDITPDAPLSQELLQRFSEAEKRAKNWK